MLDEGTMPRLFTSEHLRVILDFAHVGLRATVQLGTDRGPRPAPRRDLPVPGWLPLSRTACTRERSTSSAGSDAAGWRSSCLMATSWRCWARPEQAVRPSVEAMAVSNATRSVHKW